MNKVASVLCASLLLAGVALAEEKKTAAKGDAAKGKEIFEQCAACHSADTDEKLLGPSLKGLFKREKLTNGKPVTEANVLAIINSGAETDKGVMPPYKDLLSDEEKANVLAYLKTL
jgi:cytochrome c2